MNQNNTIGTQEEQVFIDVPIECKGVPDSDGVCDKDDPCPNTYGVRCYGEVLRMKMKEMRRTYFLFSFFLVFGL